MDRGTIIYFVGGFLILIGLLLLYYLVYVADGFVTDEIRPKVNIEIIKFVINSLIVGGAGLFLYKIKSESDHFHEDQKHKTAFVKSIIEHYNRAKSVRRRIRFANIGKKQNEYRFDGATLDELLLELNDAQLALETSKKIARAKPRYLQPHAEQVEERLATMEKFLNAVVKKSFGKFNKVTVIESNGGDLYEFIGPHSGCKDSRCENNLFSKMDEIIADLS